MTINKVFSGVEVHRNINHNLSSTCTELLLDEILCFGSRAA
jgi:hypothetical protein